MRLQPIRLIGLIIALVMLVSCQTGPLLQERTAGSPLPSPTGWPLPAAALRPLPAGWQEVVTAY